MGTHSWGRYPDSSPRQVIALRERDAPLPLDVTPVLPLGNGRSYGDSCLNDGGTLLRTLHLDRFLAFDPDTGILRCEAGILLDRILEVVVPRGWFLPVTPGTAHVTLGGAIANDVHGKNHHRAGSFGRHVRAFELLRSDGSRTVCTPHDNTDLFAATIAGLGLTGLITWAEIQLIAIPGPWLRSETVRFADPAGFHALADEHGRNHDYTVAWVDCLAPAGQRGRGLFTFGNFVPTDDGPPAPKRRWSVPLTPPVSLVNGWSTRLFNWQYYRRADTRRRTIHYRPFFHPLDAIGHWNRLYGPRGFVQHQCVLPPENAAPALTELIDTIAADGRGSFLAVLKTFGDLPSPGLLSFPRPGTTLALDFPFRGEATLRLLDRLDAIVAAAHGAVYPAKDARMSAASFQRFFPEWQRFAAHVDPAFSSGFWRRVAAPATMSPDHQP